MATRLYAPGTDSGRDFGYVWVRLAHPDLLGMHAYVNIWMQDEGRDTGCLFAQVVPPAPAPGLTLPPTHQATQPAAATDARVSMGGGSSGSRG